MLVRLREVVEISSVVGTRGELDEQLAILGILIVGLPMQEIDEFVDVDVARCDSV